MATPRSFLRVWIIGIVGLSAVVIAANLLVDPYEVFGTPRIGGISRLKPGVKNHVLLAKTYQVARARPATVLIGSSSTHIGIDVDSSQWPEAMRPVYNFGIPGQYAPTGLRALRETVAVGSVKQAIVFLDFQNFFSPDQPAASMSEDERRFHTLPGGALNHYRPWQVATDMFLSLATMDSLIDSISTVVGQANPILLNVAPDGSSNEADFIHEAYIDGMHDLFAQKELYEVARAERLKQVMADWHGSLPDIDIVAGMLAFARANGVTLTLAIVPHHGDALEIYRRMGLWERVEQLKVELTALAAEQGGAVILWDFLDYSAFNTEPVPAAGDRHTPTHWYWEPSHFKKQLGEIMIQRMFGQGAPSFGERLTPDNVLAHNAMIRSQRQARVCEHRGDAFLTALAKPMPDGCDHAQQPNGPT